VQEEHWVPCKTNIGCKAMLTVLWEKLQDHYGPNHPDARQTGRIAHQCMDLVKSEIMIFFSTASEIMIFRDYDIFQYSFQSDVFQRL
jgi:hypothetical protein